MAFVSLCLVLYVSTQPRPLFLWAFIFNLRFRPFSIRRGRPFALSVFAPSCLCSLNTSGGGVHIVHVVYIRAGCLDAAPLGGAGGGFRAFVFCCTKRGRACDTSNERANAAHAAKEQRGGGLFFSTRRACLCSVVHVVHIRGGLFLLLVWYSLNAAAVGVHIVHVVYIRAGCVDAAPPRRAVLRLSGFGLLLHEKANTTKEQHGAASSFPAAGRLSTLSILSIFGACLIISSMFGGCPCCLYLSISGAVQFISRGRGCVEALASCCTKGAGRVDMSNERANAAHGAKNSTGRPLLLHTAGRLSTLSIFGRRLGVAPPRRSCLC